jgi:hypothetical protein
MPCHAARMLLAAVCLLNSHIVAADPGLPATICLHRVQKLAEVHGFAQTGYAERTRLRSNRAHADNGDRRDGCRMFQLPPAELEAVHHWHHQIEQDGTGALAPKKLQCLTPVPRDGDDITVHFEQALEHHPRVVVIVYNQDLRHR